MFGKDDTAKLYALDEEALGDIDDTDSLPVIADDAEEPARDSHRESRGSQSASVDRLDWLISITTAVDKRVERIEEDLHQIKILLADERKKKKKRGKSIRSILSDIRRRLK